MNLPRCAVALCSLGLVSTALTATAAAQTSTYVESSVNEVPNAVAVAENGTVVASIFDAQGVALVDPAGIPRFAQLDCSPNDVAIAPSGETAWAVCQTSEHVYVIDFATAAVAVAGVETTGMQDITYLPAVDQLLIASIDGVIITVSEVSTGGYLVSGRVVLPEWRFTGLAPFPDGTRTYAITDGGDLLYVDIEFAGQVVELHRATGDRYFLSIAVNPTATALYAAVTNITEPGGVTSMEKVDAATGEALQSVGLNLTDEGIPTVVITAGDQDVFVASGLYAATPQGESGLLTLPVGADGRLGPVEALPLPTRAGSAVALSANGLRLAFATTNATVIGAVVDAPPRPVSIRVSASVKGKVLRVTGTTTSVPAGTRLTVWVKDLTAKKARFIKMRKSTLVSSDGTVSWRGRAISRRMSVYVSGGGVISNKVIVAPRRSEVP